MALSCSVSFSSKRASSSLKRRASSRFELSSSRNLTKARTTWTLISTARGLLRMVGACMAPCSVKASGSLRRPPQLDVAKCDFKILRDTRIRRGGTLCAGARRQHALRQPLALYWEFHACRGGRCGSGGCGHRCRRSCRGPCRLRGRRARGHGEASWRRVLGGGRHQAGRPHRCRDGGFRGCCPAEPGGRHSLRGRRAIAEHPIWGPGR